MTPQPTQPPDFQIHASEVPQLVRAAHLFLQLSLMLSEYAPPQPYMIVIGELQKMRPLLARFEVIAQKLNRVPPLAALENLARHQFRNIAQVQGALHQCTVVSSMLVQAAGVVVENMLKRPQHGAQQGEGEPIVIDPKKLN